MNGVRQIAKWGLHWNLSRVEFLTLVMPASPLITILEHTSIVAAAVSGALAARGRGVDLFGVLVLAVVASFGGGTLRDVCLGATPVFWIRDSSHVVTALTAGLLTFFIGRSRDYPLPPWLLELADAIGLALFATIGTQKAFVQFNATPLAAVALGVVTGVCGGVFRDVLLNEIPVVFRKGIKLYATAAVIGTSVYIILRKTLPAFPESAAFLIGTAVILALRLAALRWSLMLPEFEDRRKR
jgi:uncharacterized membrane protein YeiH